MTTPAAASPWTGCDGATDQRHAEEVLASFLDALLDGRGNFLGLAVADTDESVAVADDHKSGEAEATTTLTTFETRLMETTRSIGSTSRRRCHDGCPDRSRPPRLSPGSGHSVRRSASAVTPLTSRHQAFLPLVMWSSDFNPPSRASSAGPRCGRCRCGHRGRRPRPPRRQPWHARRSADRPWRREPSCRPPRTHVGLDGRRSGQGLAGQVVHRCTWMCRDERFTTRRGRSGVPETFLRRRK